MASTIILSDNGASSGSAGLKQTAGNDGVLILQTTTSGGTATNAVYVDTSQNVGLGTASPSLKLTIAGAMNLTNSSRAGAFEITSGGDLWTGTATTAGNIIFETGHTTSGLPSTGTERVKINQYGIGLGATTPSSGTGIAFPATQSASTDANTLDDYEEGTFTVTLTGGFSTGPTSYTSQSGSYTKIGRLVFFQFDLNPNGAVANATGVVFSGLPFISINTGNYSGAYMNYQIDFDTNTLDTFHITSASTTIVIYDQSGNNRLGNAAGININNRIILSGCYQTT